MSFSPKAIVYFQFLPETENVKKINPVDPVNPVNPIFIRQDLWDFLDMFCLDHFPEENDLLQSAFGGKKLSILVMLPKYLIAFRLFIFYASDLPSFFASQLLGIFLGAS